MTATDAREPGDRRPLDGQVALVTGASSGIGAATARMLADAGAGVGLAARREEQLATVADTIESAGGEAVVVPTDVSDPDAVTAMVDRVRERFDGLDILVNNAGVGHWEALGVADGDPEHWRHEVAVNLLGLMTATHAAAQVFLEQGSGHIVNVSSGAGRLAFPQYPGYVASKFGVTGFTESVRRNLVPEGVRVTLVEPGEVDTAMNAGEPAADREQMLRPEDIADAIRYAVTRPTHVTVNDIMLVPTAYRPGEHGEGGEEEAEASGQAAPDAAGE